MSLEIRIDTYTPTRNEQLRVKAEITKGWICLGDQLHLHFETIKKSIVVRCERPPPDRTLDPG